MATGQAIATHLLLFKHNDKQTQFSRYLLVFRFIIRYGKTSSKKQKKKIGFKLKIAFRFLYGFSQWVENTFDTHESNKITHSQHIYYSVGHYHQKW